MKTYKREVVVQRLDERRCALAVDGVVRYVGTEEECQRRLAMLVPKNERADQDKALGRLWRILRVSMNQFVLTCAAMVFSFSAFAAGVDSRAYTCDGLHALVGANHFVFINYPSFMDFVVANGSYCSAGEMLGLRSVPTSDNPECLVNYCRKRPSTTN